MSNTYVFFATTQAIQCCVVCIFVHLRVEDLEPGHLNRIGSRCTMCPVSGRRLCQADQTQPLYTRACSNPRLSVFSTSTITLVGWLLRAQLEGDELTTGSFCVDKKPGAASVRDVSHYSRWQLPYQRDAPSCPTSTLTTNLFGGLEQSRLTSSSLKLTLHACAYPAASVASSQICKFSGCRRQQIFM